jgi:hypothetical protein
MNDEKSNLAHHALCVAILEKFDDVRRVMENGLTEKVEKDTRYLDAAKAVDEQHNRLLVGLGRLDEADNWDDFDAIKERLLEICSTDLTGAVTSWMRSYIEAIEKVIELE